MLDLHLKIAKDWQLHPDSSLTWIRCDLEGVHKCIKAFRLILVYELIMVMPFIIQSVSALVPNPVWAWPLTLLPRWSPADSEDQRGPICFVSARNAFTATTRDILSPRIYVSWLKPAPHRETVSVSCLHQNIWVYLSFSISGATLQVPWEYLTGMNYKWRKHTVSAVSLIRQSSPEVLCQEKALITLKSG